MINQSSELININRDLSSCNIKGVKILTGDFYSFRIKEALDQLYLERCLEQGFCTVCKCETSKFCSNCGTHYCGSTCQNSDWPNHKLKCNRSLVQSWISTGFNQSTIRTETVQPISPKRILENNKFLDKKSDLKSTGKSSADDRDSLNRRHENYGDFRKQSTNLRNSLSDKKNEGWTNDKRFSAEQKMNFYQRTSGGSKAKENVNESDISRCITKPTSPTQSNGLASKALRKTSLRGGEIINVVCNSWESDNVCWVTDVENEAEFKNVQTELLKECVNSANIRCPLEGDVCCCKVNGLWYRSKIISTEPKLMILCIDTGEIFDRNVEELKELPDSIKSVAAMAFRIELVGDVIEDTFRNGQKKTMIEVIRTSKSGIVQAKRINRSNPIKNMPFVEDVEKTIHCLPEKNINTRRFAIDELEVGSTGMFIPMKIGRQMVGRLIPENVEDASHCHNKISGLYCMEGDVIDAAAGDVVMVGTGDHRGQRGIVLSKPEKNQFEVYLIDDGYAVRTNKVFSLEKKLENLMELACKISLTRENFSSLIDRFEENNAYDFEVKKKLSGNRWFGVLKFDDTEVKVEFDRTDDRAFPSESTVSFMSGCIVTISALAGKNAVYVRHLDNEYESMLRDFILKLNMRPGSIDKDFMNSVKEGDLLWARYQIDDIFYRGKVLSRQGDQVNVLFVDYGNMEIVNVSELRPLLPSCRRIPYFAKTVMLINEIDHSSSEFSDAGIEYLNRLIKDSTELILTYDGDMSKGVLLKVRDECFKINQCIYDVRPTEKTRSKDPGLCLSSKDEFTKFLRQPICFVKGAITNFLILYVDQTEFMEKGFFWATNPRSERFSYIMNELTEKITSYCNSVPSCYTPQDNELCFAKFEGGWYRGLAVEDYSKTKEIFFVDFGNRSVVESEWIRKFCRELFEAPPMAVKCVVEGFETMDEETRLSAYDFVCENTNEIITTVTIIGVQDEICRVTFDK